MARNTKERIMETALELFAEKGYLGTSMNDIAKQLGFTKAALYKHYASKQEILDRIVERMNEMDCVRAKQFEMPEGNLAEIVAAYQETPIEKVRAYSKAQFLHWTEEEFSSRFRKMLTLEQYRDPEMAQLYQKYLATGPVDYMTAIFSGLTESKKSARHLALEFYGPIFLLYSVSDSGVDRKQVLSLLDAHVDRFIHQMESMRRKEARA